MRKIAIVLVVLTLTAGWNSPCYCQDTSSDEAAIDQSESQAGQGLGSEEASDEAQGQAEVGGMDASMNTGGDGS